MEVHFFKHVCQYHDKTFAIPHLYSYLFMQSEIMLLGIGKDELFNFYHNACLLEILIVCKWHIRQSKWHLHTLSDSIIVYVIFNCPFFRFYLTERLCSNNTKQSMLAIVSVQALLKYRMSALSKVVRATEPWVNQST